MAIGRRLATSTGTTVGITTTDTASIDAFGRLRVSEPVTVFDSKQISDTQPLFWLDGDKTTHEPPTPTPNGSLTGA